MKTADNIHVTTTDNSHVTTAGNIHLPYSHFLTSSSPHPNSQQPSSPRHNLSRQHTAVQSPSHPPQYYHQDDQPIAKKRTEHTWSIFFYSKNNEPRAPIGQYSRSKWFIEEEKTRLLRQNKNQRLFTKSKIGHKQQNRSRPTKMTITSKEDHQQYQQLQLHICIGGASSRWMYPDSGRSRAKSPQPHLLLRAIMPGTAHPGELLRYPRESSNLLLLMGRGPAWPDMPRHNNNNNCNHQER